MNTADKFALLSYNTTNLGDDIQSLAALQFLPGVDVRIDRDMLAVQPDGAPDQAKIILNGWHTHAPEQWPPAPFLSPLMISMHLTKEVLKDNRGGLPPSEFLLRGAAFRYFNKRAPIGARDLWTRDLFRQYGVSADFTGCLTLTLGGREKFARQGYVCAVDLPPRALLRLRKSSTRQIVAVSHHTQLGPSWGDRAWAARRLLRLYAHAECVLTTRLHCALPCLALGTPVLLLRTAWDSYRFSGLDALLRGCTLDEYLSGAVEFDVNAPPSNPDAFLDLRQALIARASEFTGLPVEDPLSPPFPFKATPLTPADFRLASDASALNPSSAARSDDDPPLAAREIRRIFSPGCDYKNFYRADFLRDIARLLAANGDLEEAVRVMRMAHVQRPEGDWISKLLKSYEGKTGPIEESPADLPAVALIKNSTIVQSVIENHLTYLSLERLKSLMAQIEGVKRRRVAGDFLEFGVASGGSGVCIASQLDGARRYWGFDAFSIIPPPSEKDGEDALRRYENIKSGSARGIGEETYYGYVDDLYGRVRTTFADYGLAVDGRSINLLRGAFDQSAPSLPSLNIAMAHVDCDWYESVMYCLRYIYPHLSRFGAIIVDDYLDWSGCRKAVDEFCASAQDVVVVKTNPHAVLIKA